LKPAQILAHFQHQMFMC